MKLMYFASATVIAASLSLSAAADLNKFDNPHPETDIKEKKPASVYQLEHLFPGHDGYAYQEGRINQTGAENEANIDQVYSDKGLGQITQDGYYNDALIEQVDYSTSGYFSRARNIAVIDQVGTLNDAKSDQTQYGTTHYGKRVNTVQIHQKSNDYYTVDRNKARAYQDGAGHKSLISQKSMGFGIVDYANNRGRTIQYGSAQHSVIDQMGWDNKAQSVQYDGYNKSTIVQRGDGYFGDNEVYVDQSGYFNSADVEQSDAYDGNQASDNYAEVSQSGTWNKAVVDQEGDSNWADVNQHGDENLAKVEQNGYYNTATVNQYSDWNVALIDQDGEGNDAYVDQYYGYDNLAVIVQDGYYNSAGVYQ